MSGVARGLHEELLTTALERRLAMVEPDTDLAYGSVDDADQPHVLARHIERAVRNLLAATSDPARRLAITNDLLATLAQHDDRITEPPRQLLSVLPSRGPGVIAMERVRPSTPLSEAALLTNARNEPRLGHELQAELDTCDEVDLLCAFVKWHGLRLLEPATGASAAGRRLRGRYGGGVLTQSEARCRPAQLGGRNRSGNLYRFLGSAPSADGADPRKRCKSSYRSRGHARARPVSAARLGSPGDMEESESRFRPGRRGRSPASLVLVEIERTNARLGHENQGPLSPASGFLPTLPPLRSFSPQHAAWDRLAAELPQLYQDLQVRAAVDALPVIGAGSDELPDRELSRAATVLGVLAHAYVHQSAGAGSRLPASLADPWTEVLHRLGRSAEPVLSYQDLILNNWALRQPGQPPPVLRLPDVDLLVPTAGNQEERVFYLTQLEIISRCGPIVGAVARAQDAVLDRDLDLLHEALAVVEHALQNVNRVSLRLIDPRMDAATHVEPVRWAKTVAPLAVPARPGVLGPSGTASPIMNLLDAFFGRPRHDSQLGREILAHRASYPGHWQQFLTAVDAVSVGGSLMARAGRAMERAYEDALAAYAGEDGFLGRHRRKVYGYLAVAFTVGRDLTIGGFTGPPQARRWDDVDLALRASGAERRAMGPVHRPSPSVPADLLRREITVAELARHNDSEHGWWVAVDDTVYDVTEFLRRHPGGAPVLQAYAGLDATAAFARAHRAPGGAYRLQRRYAVGRLCRPPDENPASAYEAAAAALRQVVELQNTFRLDRSFLRGTLLVDASGPPATAFQVDRAEDLYARFTDSYLPALRSRLWGLGTVTGPTAESAAVLRPERPLSSGLPVQGVMRQADLRQRLDDIEDRLAADKQTATRMVTAVLGRTKAA